jgi:hypothetical protein
MTLLARVANEHRRVLVPLGLLAVVNVGVLALAVYPLSLKVAASQRRADAAAGRLAQVEREVSRVHATLATTEQADRTWHALRGRAAARRLGGAPPDVCSPGCARRRAQPHVTRRTYAIDEAYKGRLQRLQIAMVLTGEYPDIRDFIYALETSPEFVVIEDVSVAEGARLESGLTVNLQLAILRATARMAAESRRQLWLLAILALTLIGVLWWRLAGSGCGPLARLDRPRARPGGEASRLGALPSRPHISTRWRPAAEPDEGTRDPFRFNAPAPRRPGR